MVRKLDDIIDPQLVVVEQHAGPAVVLTNKVKLSLYKKSKNSGFPADILEEVFARGHSVWNESFAGTPEQFAFDRVNSFIAGGFAAQLDADLLEDDKKTPKKKPMSLHRKLQIQRQIIDEDKDKSHKETVKKVLKDKRGGKTQVDMHPHLNKPDVDDVDIC